MCSSKIGGSGGYIAGNENPPFAPASSIAVAFRLIRADLKGGGARFGCTSVYAKADAVYEDSDSSIKTIQIIRTVSDCTGDLTPVWNHLAIWLHCGGKCEIQVRVKMPAGGVSSNVLGSVNFQLDGILNKGIRTLDLHPGEGSATTGEGSTVTLQAFVLSEEKLQKQLNSTEVQASTVDPKLFEKPVSSLSKSGGTAAFYGLRLAEVPHDQKTTWIGKDLQHTPQETAFYAGREHYIDDGSGLSDLLDFMFEGLGVVTLPTNQGGPSESSEVKLLVIKNLFHSCGELRMLDVKIGQKSASSGWYGKSMITAMERSYFDKYTTNSGLQGFRLAGFNGKPSSMESRDPMHDMPSITPEKDAKNAARVVLGNLPCNQILIHFMDMHDKALPSDTAKVLLPDELLEISMNEAISKLLGIAIACRKVVVPQKWVGSSISIGFDAEPAGHLLDRAYFFSAERLLRDNVKVNIFDWGRSELNTMANHNRLDAEEQKDRAVFWQYYVEGVDRMVWHFLRSYRHRFCNVGSLASLKCEVYDYDADITKQVFSDKYCCEVDLPVEDTHGEKTIRLLDKAAKEAGELTYSMSYTTLPKGARLAGYWQVTLLRATGLPAKDGCSFIGAKSDPYVVLTAYCSAHPDAGEFEYVSTHQGKVVKNTVSPEWNETFCIPIASRDGLAHTLQTYAPGLAADYDLLKGFFPPDDADAEALNGGLRLWINALDAYVVREGLGAPVGRMALMGGLAEVVRDKITDAAKQAVSNPSEFAQNLGGAMASAIGGVSKAVARRASRSHTVS